MTLSHTFSGLVLIVWILALTDTIRCTSSLQQEETDNTDQNFQQKSSTKGVLCLFIQRGQEPKLCSETPSFLRHLSLSSSGGTVAEPEGVQSDESDSKKGTDDKEEHETVEIEKIPSESGSVIDFYKRAMYQKIGVDPSIAANGKFLPSITYSNINNGRLVPVDGGDVVEDQTIGASLLRWLNEKTAARTYGKLSSNIAQKRMASSLRNRSNPTSSSSAGRRIFIGFPMFDNVLYRNGRARSKQAVSKQG
ncbi:uncharacterized protein [Ptychodera flava]|uniref:uncharacterized protein n=1 Tax=Ptychodera flava TaxID=63121 RepID=UPI00396A35A6